MPFEDEVVDLMRHLRYPVEEYDVDSILDAIDRVLPDDVAVKDMDRRSFRSIVERYIW